MDRPHTSAVDAGLTAYEIQRNLRVASNAQYLEELGLSAEQIFQPLHPSQKRVRKVRSANHEAVAVRRRSERIQNLPAPLYSSSNAIENADAPPKMRKTGVSLTRKSEFVARIEEYGPEDMNLLGSSETVWVLIIDGYTEGGQKALDPVKGKTCHQCRQKTLGQRTSCYRCRLTQGQFCGDCLYTRYGENVEEACRKAEWLCPPCRGICNCSICRDKRGWPPTGQLWHKASRAGYPSVAHYLMSTKQKIQVDSGETITETKPTTVGHNNALKRTPKSLVKNSGAESQEVNPYAAMVEEKIGSQKESQVNATVRTREGIQSKVEKYFCGVKPTSKKVHMAQKKSKKKK